jgi:cephalosporin hydroxylase
MTFGQVLNVAATALRDGPVPLRLARRAIREYGAVQRTWELQSLIGEVKRRRPRVIVEIGTHRGGTLACWAAIAPPGAHIVSIDMVTESMGTREEDLARVRRTLGPSLRLTAITGDSHAPDTLARLRDALGGEPIDVLWIDGDHSYPGVKQDFEMYGPLVGRGGLIAFHDIHGSRLNPDAQSHVFWQEIRPRYRTREFIAEPEPGGGMGIGVVYT